MLGSPNPLTPTLSPLGRGSSLRQLLRTLMASFPVLAARLGARVFLCAIGNGSRAREIRSRLTRNRSGAGKGQGWLPAFRSSVTPVSPDQASRIKINEGSGTPANAGHQPPHLAMRRALIRSAHACRRSTAASCDAARAHSERARLSAFHRGSHLRELFHPKGSASGQASWDVV
jgi:hypothetical protein